MSKCPKVFIKISWFLFSLTFHARPWEVRAAGKNFSWIKHSVSKEMTMDISLMFKADSFYERLCNVLSTEIIAGIF